MASDEKSPPPPLLPSSSSSSCPLLNLPIEIRQKIYNLSIPYTKLHIHPITNDTDWLNYKSDPTNNSNHHLPCKNLPFTSRQIYTETINLFYSRATLAIRPTPTPWIEQSSSPSSSGAGSGSTSIPSNLPDSTSTSTLNTNTETKTESHFHTHLNQEFTHIPRPFLQQIKTIHIYTGQLHIYHPGSIRVLLRWVIENTGVENIWVSRKMVQQWRHLVGDAGGKGVRIDDDKFEFGTRLRSGEYDQSSGGGGGEKKSSDNSDGDGDSERRMEKMGKRKKRVIDIYSETINSRVVTQPVRFSSLVRSQLEVVVYCVVDLKDGGNKDYDDGMGRRLSFVKRYGMVGNGNGSEDGIGEEEEKCREVLKGERLRFHEKEMGDWFMREAHEKGRLGLIHVIEIHGVGVESKCENRFGVYDE